MLSTVLSEAVKPVTPAAEKFKGVSTFDQLQTYSLMSNADDRWNQKGPDESKDIMLDDIDAEELALRIVNPNQVKDVLASNGDEELQKAHALMQEFSISKRAPTMLSSYERVDEGSIRVICIMLMQCSPSMLRQVL